VRFSRQEAVKVRDSIFSKGIYLVGSRKFSAHQVSLLVLMGSGKKYGLMAGLSNPLIVCSRIVNGLAERMRVWFESQVHSTD
jgi:hypothetical protein